LRSTERRGGSVGRATPAAIVTACAPLGLVLLLAASLGARAPETLRAVNAIPAHLAGGFGSSLVFQPAGGGATYVFDRRNHTVARIDATRTTVTRLVTIGGEEGRLLAPLAFSAAPDGSFAVADSPREKERIQVFNAEGQRIGGFELPSRALPRIAFDGIVMNGVGSIHFSGRRLLVSQPDTGSLATEYDIYGQSVRSIGQLRPTGHEHDAELHVALNSGLPFATPDGGLVFVFQAGEPAFRRYDARGALVYERRIEGRELDPFLKVMPRAWPRRRIDDREIPLVSPTVRAAALDAQQHVWVSLAVPFVYEYDADGDKRRAVQLHAAGIVSPTSLAFAGSRLLVAPGLAEFDTR
jgi:hypothetical protein